MTIGGHAAGEGSSASRDGGSRESWMPAAIRLPRRVRPGAGERDLGAVKQLMAADGLANTAIAQRLDVDVVSRWRKPFAEGGLAVPTASAPGRPRTFTAPVVAGDGAGVRAARGERDAAGEVELPGPRDRGPGHHGVYLGAHGAPLAGAGRAQAVAAPVLDLPRDPYFAVKAARVFDLYERVWEARPLGGDEMCSVPMRKPACRPGAFIRPSAGPPARCGRKTSTPAAAPWPTWPPTTCTAGR